MPPRQRLDTPPPPADATIRIRPLARGDLAAVSRLEATHTGGSEKRAFWRRLFAEFLATPGSRRHVGLAAEGAGGLVGYLLGDVRALEFGSEPCGWIFAIGVDPAALRQGVGRALLDGARARFRAAGVSRVRTMVRRNDIPVLAFFRAGGFAGGPYVQLECDLVPVQSRSPSR